MIEESLPSVTMARFNVSYHQAGNLEIHHAKVEDVLQALLKKEEGARCLALVDPPRKGLAENAKEALSGSQDLKTLFYLSCSPDSLVFDLKTFLKKGWRVERVVPFDFFPKTRHLETLVLLKQD